MCIFNCGGIYHASRALVGTVFGSSLDPLHASIDGLTLDDTNNDDPVRSNDSGQTGESIIYGGVGSVFDSEIDYTVTLTYCDATSAVTEMVLLQDEPGCVFLIPKPTDNPANDVLNDKPKVSITLDVMAACSPGPATFRGAQTLKKPEFPKCATAPRNWRQDPRTI